MSLSGNSRKIYSIQELDEKGRSSSDNNTLKSKFNE
jgi:hypothetical protein